MKALLKKIIIGLRDGKGEGEESCENDKEMMKEEAGETEPEETEDDVLMSHMKRALNKVGSGVAGQSKVMFSGNPHKAEFKKNLKSK